MEEKKNIFQNKKLLLIIPVLLVVAVIGVTYAFFNYTRTGGTNTARTGTISFNTDQNNDTLTLTNVFPSSSVPLNADSVAVHITGDTTYSGGVEFQIALVNVVNTVNNKTIPINYVATYTATPTTGNIGTSKATDEAYYTDHGSTTTIYKLNGSGVVSEGTEVLKGFIAAGAANGIDGVLTIQAYLDSSKVLISDTITNGAIEASGYVNGTPAAEVVLTTAEWNALTGNNTLSFKIRAVANEGIWVKQIPTISLSPASGGVASGSSTTSTISTTGDGTMTCSSSNQSIATCSVSGSTLTINGVAVGNATITVNQAEGTNYTAGNATYLATVEAPAYPTISSCEGCKFIYTENEYFYSANNYKSSPISTLTTFENNNETLVDDYTTLNKNYFLGFKFDGNGVITNAYACGIKGTDYLNDEEQTPGVNAGTAFCVEGSTDGSTYSATNTFLNDSTTGIWQGRCDDDGRNVYCDGSVAASARSLGSVSVEAGDDYCDVSNGGLAGCY